MTSTEPDALNDLLSALGSADAYPHPCETIRCIQTHISWVFLTGSYAYKVKKPVDFGFLDFSTLAKRRHYCEEELRCNRRFAPELYLEVVAIRAGERGIQVGALDSGSNSGSHSGARGPLGEPLEYAVRMRQFPTSAELDVRLANDELASHELADFGRDLAAIHAELPRVGSDAPWGTAGAVRNPVLENFTQIAGSPYQAEFDERLNRLVRWCEEQHGTLVAQLDARRADGFVRECHGDLHLSNMVSLDDGITAFDCIEFSPALRWIDVISDAAFLLMDCQVRDRPDLGYAFLNAYLEATGDYPGGRLLGYYVVYRSLVRAKVAALQAEAADSRARFERHLEFAEQRAFAARPVLVLTCGLSGSGKSWLAERLVTALGAVRIRSDVERKRLHGLDAAADSQSGVDQGIYQPAATQAVYERLQQSAQALLAGGESVLVDATFLEPRQREAFIAMARELATPARILYCTAPVAVLEARIAKRSGQGGDPSEADVAVLTRQREGFIPPEGEGVITVQTQEEVDVATLAKQIRGETRLQRTV
jgi:aminoglycoside phosphotransferase family enzyme/predicted kinase